MQKVNLAKPLNFYSNVNPSVQPDHNPKFNVTTQAFNTKPARKSETRESNMFYNSMTVGQPVNQTQKQRTTMQNFFDNAAHGHSKSDYTTDV